MSGYLKLSSYIIYFVLFFIVLFFHQSVHENFVLSKRIQFKSMFRASYVNHTISKQRKIASAPEVLSSSYRRFSTGRKLRGNYFLVSTISSPRTFSSQSTYISSLFCNDRTFFPMSSSSCYPLGKSILASIPSSLHSVHNNEKRRFFRSRATASLLNNLNDFVSSRANPLQKSYHLVLVFDINKTILMDDKAGGKTSREVLNEILSDLAWGEEVLVENLQQRSNDGDTKWIPRSDLPLSPTPPKTQNKNPNLMNYADYIHKKYPDNLQMKGDKKALQTRKKLRDSLKGSFTNPGQPGDSEPYLHALEKLQNGLLLSTYIKNGYTQSLNSILSESGLLKEKIKSKNENTNNSDESLIDLSGLQVRLLPAFFCLLQQLANEKWSFSLQLRTFGTDLEDVLKEFNAFCLGRHPYYPGYSLNDETGYDYTVKIGQSPSTNKNTKVDDDKNYYGTFYRGEEGILTLTLGSLDQSQFVNNDEHQKKMLQLVRDGISTSLSRSHTLLIGDQRIHSYIKEQETSDKRTLALRDYWPFWRNNLETASCGKMVFFESSDIIKRANNKNNNLSRLKQQDGQNNENIEKNRLVLIFDDNVEYHDAHIIDAREIHSETYSEHKRGEENFKDTKGAMTVTSTPIPFKNIFDKYLFRAEPYFAITSPKSYFIDIVHRSILLHHNSRKQNDQ